MPQNEERVPKVSIVSIALKSEDFKPLLERLSLQSYQDYEFIGEVGGSIPEAWNKAIQRAHGEILVFTETDARPVNELWLEEMVNAVSNPKIIVKGLEVTTSSLDLSNLAVHRKMFIDHSFDGSFQRVTDIELMCRLKEEGYHIIPITKAPIMNFPKAHNRHFFRRVFLYGFQWGRLKKRYIEPIEMPEMSFASNRLLASFYLLCGMVIGFVIYLPERKLRNYQNTR